jgi:hypothetical protein
MSTLQQLHDLLLDRSKWPDDFTWDYNDAKTCAIGLAHKAGLIHEHPHNVHGHTFGISDHAAYCIFFSVGSADASSYTGVTPEMIAKRIAAIL